MIDRVEELEALRGTWESLYARDPNAHFFVSWTYLRSWLGSLPGGWFVLAAADGPGGPDRALLPLARTTRHWRGVPLERELHMGGKPFADLTGFLCDPAVEERALAALATHVRDALAWDRFTLAEVLDPRLERFLAAFPDAAFVREGGTPLVSPCASLAATWDDYLQRSLTSKGRYDVRRAIRNTEEAPGFRRTWAAAGDLEAHLDALLALWQARWGSLRPERLAQFRAVFRGTFSRGALDVVVVWDGDVPMAAAACFLDPARSAALQFITAYDAKFSKRSPGRAVVGYAVQAAIERGLHTYDFLLGDEEYKYSFGARDRRTETVTLVRRGWRSSAARLLRRLRRGAG